MESKSGGSGRGFYDLRPPKALTDDARELWDTIAPELASEGREFTHLYRNLLEQYCVLMAIARKQGQIALTADTLIPGPRGTQKIHPIFAQFNAVVNRQLQFSKALAKKDANDNGEEDDGFDDFTDGKHG